MLLGALSLADGGPWATWPIWATYNPALRVPLIIRPKAVFCSLQISRQNPDTKYRTPADLNRTRI